MLLFVIVQGCISVDRKVLRSTPIQNFKKEAFHSNRYWYLHLPFFLLYSKTMLIVISNCKCFFFIFGKLFCFFSKLSTRDFVLKKHVIVFCSSCFFQQKLVSICNLNGQNDKIIAPLLHNHIFFIVHDSSMFQRKKIFSEPPTIFVLLKRNCLPL